MNVDNDTRLDSADWHIKGSTINLDEVACLESMHALFYLDTGNCSVLVINSSSQALTIWPATKTR